MKKIKAVKSFIYNGKMVLVDEVIDVDNNDAFGLIDSSRAVLYVPESNNKMLNPRGKKSYIIK